MRASTRAVLYGFCVTSLFIFCGIMVVVIAFKLAESSNKKKQELVIPASVEARKIIDLLKDEQIDWKLHESATIIPMHPSLKMKKDSLEIMMFLHTAKDKMMIFVDYIEIGTALSDSDHTQIKIQYTRRCELLRAKQEQENKERQQKALQSLK